MENENYKGPSPSDPDEQAKSEKAESPDVVEQKEKVQEPEAEEKAAEEDDCLDQDHSINHDESKMALADDSVKVKFTSNSVNQHENGEPRVDIEGGNRVAFAGMGKEELMKFAEDPFWVRLRWSLFALFWLLWLAMLVGAIVIVIVTPGCAPLPARDWWQRGAAYQVYAKSFADSNGDGVGDLQGLKSKLSHLDDLGVNTLLLSPIFKSPMIDEGYDISNYVEIDPTFGNISDFTELLADAKEKGLRVILDFVPNHSSDQHEWFIKSKNKEPGFEDFYVWANGLTPGDVPPNNWLSVFGGSAWTFDNTRGQYYLHQFDKSQPDLNLRSPAVKKELEKILEFWLTQGVDGFRVDAANHLFEDPELRNESKLAAAANSSAGAEPPSAYSSLFHNYTTGLPEVFDLLREWREFLDNYAPDGEHKLLVAEVYDSLGRTMRYYGTENGSLTDFPFNYELLKLTGESTGKQVHELIHSWLDVMPTGKWPNWVLSNHDVSRVASRTHPDLIDGLNMITALIGGTPIIYYGDEIGMKDVPIDFAQVRDPRAKKLGAELYRGKTRDSARTPMQWSNASQGGFSSGDTPWLPLGDFQATNVESQLAVSGSHLSVLRRLLGLREEPAIVYGELVFPMNVGNVVAFARVKKGSPGYAVVVNFGHNATTANLHEKECCANFKFPDDGVVVVVSRSTNPETAVLAKLGEKPKVPLTAINLGPREAVVFKFVPSF